MGLYRGAARIPHTARPEPKSISGIDTFAGGIEMPLLYTDLGTLQRSIRDIAARFSKSRRLSWNIDETRGTRKSNFRIRASDKASGNHQCWVTFSASQVDQCVVLDSTMCNKSHSASKMHNAILVDLIHLYGHPPDGGSAPSGVAAQPPSRRQILRIRHRKT